MNSRRPALLALFVTLLLTISGSLVISSNSFLYSSSFFPSQNNGSSAPSTPSGLILNGSSVEIPISLPTKIALVGDQGVVSPSLPISLDVVISSRNPVGLDQYLNEIDSPVSPKYHDFLSPQEYQLLFGPDSSEINSLFSYFASKGLDSEVDQANPSILHVSGDAREIESALDTSIDSFRTSNSSFYSPLTMPELPSRFSFVQGIYGLSNYSTTSAFASPMYRTFGEITGKPDQSDSNNIYYTPSEIAQIYNSSSLMAAGYNGTGVTIAIVDAYGDPTIQQELENFSAQFNLPQLTINQICIDGPCNYANGVSQGWQPEIALDVEWAHAMAPGANINLYIGSNDTFPLYDAVEAAVENSSNSIISMSWGSPENSIAATSPVAPIEGESYPWLDQALQQAAAEGITAFSSAGDWGAWDQSYMGESLPYGGASYPSTDPYVTAVGGTSVYMNTTAGTLQFPYSNATGTYGSETAWSWSDEYDWGTGGGYSSIFPSPVWQKGPGIDQSIGMRGAPDVAWDADPATGVAIALYDVGTLSIQYFVEGGTSVGSPSWAGSLATIEQKAGHKLGLITPELYSILNNPAEYAKAFHDITTGNNNPNSAGVGWSPLTGVGTPNLGELANLLGPSGSLDLSVTNSLSSQFISSFAYGSQVGITANITDGGSPVSSGSVTAVISGPSGQTIATGIPLSFNSVTNEWSGSYTIKSTDPPGEWTATVTADTGSGISGWGVTTFSVGDGVDIFLPIFNLTTLAAAVPKFTVGQTVNVTAKITPPDGICCVTSGNFSVYFNANSTTGKNEGTVSLTYNSTSQLWTAHYKIPPTVDQESWAMTVAGRDSSGNAGSAYNWMYVGLNINLATDSPTYILGNTMSVMATPEYAAGTEASTGSFTATVTDGSQLIATLPLALNPTRGYWEASLPLTSSSPTGFYMISVSGNDGHGSAGTAETVVRIAPYNLNGSVSIPSPEVSVNGGSEPMVAARITYPNGSLVTQGSADAFVYLDHDGFRFLIGLIRLTFNSATGSFVGPELLPTSGPLNTTLGSYYVNVEAFDAQGNFANLSSSFFVQGETHQPISITNNSEFTFANGVVQGNGTGLDPYVFAGWNTSSISISGGATGIFQLFNDWVSGSSTDGIYLNSSAASGSLLEFTFANSNSRNGIDVNGMPGITLIADEADGNAGSGVSVGNTTSTLPPDIALTVANNNGVNGFSIQDSKFAIVQDNAATSDGDYGYYLNNLLNATIEFNNATSDRIGMYITGSGYGVSRVFYSVLEKNDLGLEINGYDQNISETNRTVSQVVVEFSLIENNTIGVLAENDSQVPLVGSTIGFNGLGVEYQNSDALVIGNVISQNNGSALEISGQYTGHPSCQVTFKNSTVNLYSFCVSGNFISLNGDRSSPASNGISEASINGSLVTGNLDSNNNGNGLDLSNVSGSSITLNSFNNNTGDGITASNISSSRIGVDNASNDALNGLYISDSSTNQIDRNNLTKDSLDGILLTSSANNTVTKNAISSIGSGCGASASCAYSGGIELGSSSDMNILTYNSISNDTVSGKIGAGIVISGGSIQNLVYENNATHNDAGIVISDSPSDTISGNYLASNTFGVYLVGESNVDLGANTLFSNQQDLFPNQPAVFFIGIRNGTSISGVVKISWNSTGQEISNQSISIDGSSSAVSGSSYSWNSTSLSDGIHFITVRVSNGAGQNASATLFVTTTNHEFLTVEAIGPNDVPLSNSLILLKNSTYSSNATTNQNGQALFHGLASGSYNTSTSINGTRITSPVSYNANSTVVLFVPTLVTTTLVPNATGASVPILVSGNLTASQLSNLVLNGSNGRYELSFAISGLQDSSASVTISIPKNSTGNGLIPSMSINGNKSEAQSYGQDSSSYYVSFIANFANGTEKIGVQLSPVPSSITVPDVILVIVVIAILVGGLVLAMSRRNRRSFYVPSQ